MIVATAMHRSSTQVVDHRQTSILSQMVGLLFHAATTRKEVSPHPQVADGFAAGALICPKGTCRAFAAKRQSSTGPEGTNSVGTRVQMNHP